MPQEKQTRSVSEGMRLGAHIRHAGHMRTFLAFMPQRHSPSLTLRVSSLRLRHENARSPTGWKPIPRPLLNDQRHQYHPPPLTGSAPAFELQQESVSHGYGRHELSRD